jgi:hypothetical protein
MTTLFTNSYYSENVNIWVAFALVTLKKKKATQAISLRKNNMKNMKK